MMMAMLQGKDNGEDDQGHLVPDIIAPDLDVVFCGTALGFRSAAERAYYAHPGNKFWKALYKHGFTPRLMKSQDYADILHFALGLTDVCKTHHGNDEDIESRHYDALRLKRQILTYQPRYLAFTGKKAAQMAMERKSTAGMSYGLQTEQWGVTKLYILPSPSGHAAKYWDEKWWAGLKSLIRA